MTADGGRLKGLIGRRIGADAREADGGADMASAADALGLLLLTGQCRPGNTVATGRDIYSFLSWRIRQATGRRHPRRSDVRGVECQTQ
jgi:hypothetical protein